MQAQIQIPEEIREEMEEMVENLKFFFEENKIQININGPEIDEDGTIYIYLESKKYIKLSEEQFDDLIEIIRNSSYYNANGAENQIANYIGYKEWLIYDEFRSFYRDVVVYLKYYEVQANGTTTYYLDHITVAGNTIHGEELEEGEYEQNEEENENE
jgi:hypothetical protein